jgi:hypothetical protein
MIVALTFLKFQIMYSKLLSEFHASLLRLPSLDGLAVQPLNQLASFSHDTFRVDVFTIPFESTAVLSKNQLKIRTF